ncbi:hypothetical protein [Legionella micdadei]|uniref:Uncharacterized protein n=1 Tax=Legionella micdadei TaxID=451 RepID=A0A098GI21_LEGMI|nr:hypothetical protein [Legionella micdadei]ARG98547.1 hypothetical protein B6N58_13275 [Legionella micdadei]ARH01291.1 hypothetical protein B6V88_13285 [Legionella micdadei]KTD27407.1 hypothetical protein Lmic_2342 [Legionella micdadei]NSL19383.1 hypothetical protein [Legionella micdadei]CEG62114.1 conserved protein of unknown function [Legionella micdadei]
MNTRLVWNFEIENDNMLNLQNLKAAREEIRWEARYFWPSNTTITLHGLDHHFLSLSNYETKHRQDCYSLLPKSNFNIKRRRMQMLYKPLLKESGMLRGYGKKINLEDYPDNEILPGTDGLSAPALLAQLKNNKRDIEVEKDALIYKFASEPIIKLELARLTIAEQIFYSACIEGKSKTLVSSIAKHLLGERVSCDYVNFLKQILAYDE